MRKDKKFDKNKTDKRGRGPKNSNPAKKGEDYRTKDREDPTMESKSTYNHPIWYKSNEVVADTMAHINWSNVSGLPLELAQSVGLASGFGRATDSSGTRKFTSQFSASGVAVARFMPAIPPTLGNETAVNINAQKLFTYVRKNNAAGTPYQSADLMLMVLAMDSAIAFYTMVRRAVGLANYYSIFNRYIPNTLVRALGFSLSDIIDHRPDYITFINMMADRINTVCVPNNLGYYGRHTWLCNNVFVDDNSIFPAHYAYVPEGFYYYDHTAGFTGGHLVFKEWALKNSSSLVDVNIDVHTLTDLKNYWNTNFGPLFYDQDVAIMSGDILKAYGTDIVQIGHVAVDYTTIPVYDQIALDQFQNTRFMGFPVKEWTSQSVTDTCDIKQNLGKLIYEPYASWASPYYWDNMRIFLNSSKDVNTSDDVLELTRNIATCYEASSAAGSGVTSDYGGDIVFYSGEIARGTLKTAVSIAPLKSCGSEWFTCMDVYGRTFDVSNGETDVSDTGYCYNTYACPVLEAYKPDSSLKSYSQRFLRVSSGLDYHPILLDNFVTKATTTLAPAMWSGYIIDCDLHRYTAFDDLVLYEMNDAIMYSELNVAKY